MKSDVYTNTVSMRLFVGLISVAAQLWRKTACHACTAQGFAVLLQAR